MKTKRFLALAVALMMVLSIVPAMTVSAAGLTWVETTKLDAYGYNLDTQARRDSSSMGVDGAEGAFVSWGEKRVGFAAFQLPEATTFNADTQALIGVLSMNAWDNNGGTNTAGVYPVDPDAVVAVSGLSDAHASKGKIIGAIHSNGGTQIFHTVNTIVDLSTAVKNGKIGLLISNIDGYGGNISTYKDLALSVAVVDKEVVYENGRGDLNKTMDSEWIEFEFTMSGADKGYRDWQVVDLDGKQFTGFCYAGSNDGFYPQDRQALTGGCTYVDGFDTSVKWTSDSSVMRITAIKTDSNAYQVTYTIVNDGTETVVAVLNYTGAFNGIKLPADWVTTQGDTDFGFNNIKVTAVDVPETIVSVTATYVANGEVVNTVADNYDTTVEDGVAFPAYGYSADGTNVMYYTAGATLAESGNIEMAAVTNAGTHSVGEIVAVDGVQYEIKSANLIPNGDFAYGLDGWLDGAGAKASIFTLNGDGTVTSQAHTGNGGNGSLYRSWAIEPGKTYVYTFYTTSPNLYQMFSLSNELGTDEARLLVGDGDVVNTGISAELGNPVANQTNTFVFTNTDNHQYAKIRFRWNGNSESAFGNFGLYEVAPATVTIVEEIESVETPAAVKVFGNDEVVLPATLKVTGTLGSNVDGTVEWDAPDAYIAGANTVSGTLTVQFGEAEPITESVSIEVTVIDEFTLPDTESFGAQPGNVVYLDMAIGSEFTMEFDYVINEIADASLQMGYNGTIFGNAAFGISPNGGTLKVTGGNKAGTSDGGTTLVESVAAGDVYHMALTMDASDDTFTLIVELADGTIVTTGEKEFRTAQDTINTMTVLRNGNNINNKGTIVISNIKGTAAPVELCTVTVDGIAKQVIKGRSYKKELTGAALVDAEGNIYAPVNGFVTVPVDADMVLTTKALGLEMVDGAQVRIGKTNLAEGGKLDAMADSGIRFIATVDRDNTLAADADEIGIKVTAEASDNAAYVPAENFQDDADTVFTAAITNLAESNYNRKYTAVAYAKFGDVEITSDAVTRSIYQVSAGIMKNGGSAEADMEYTVDGVVKNILNAYVNQTGIRLSYDATTGIAVEENKYTGDVFFTVTSVSDGDDGWNVTITPDTSWGTPAEIAAWWTDYVRFNNNNSKAKEYISASHYVNSDPVYIHEDGTLTFNFDTTDDGTGGFDGPWVPLG